MNQDAKHILDAALRDALPGAAVGQALDQIVFQPGGRLILVAAGKAAWEMARAAHERLGGRIDAGVVVTKYDYSRGPLGSLEIYEAGHPVPDENSYRATAHAPSSAEHSATASPSWNDTLRPQRACVLATSPVDSAPPTT